MAVGITLSFSLSVYLHITFVSADLALFVQRFEMEQGHFQRRPLPFKPLLPQHKKGEAYVCELRGARVTVWKVITVAEQTAARLEAGESERIEVWRKKKEKKKR